MVKSSSGSNMVDGKLAREMIYEIQRREKDDDRFEKIQEIQQERVPWKEGIILCLHEKPYVVQKGDGSRMVKCLCGHEFCEPRENWKLESLVYAAAGKGRFTAAGRP